MINLEKKTDRPQAQATSNDSCISQQKDPSSQGTGPRNNHIILFIFAAILALGLIIFFVARPGSESNPSDENASVENELSTSKRSFGQFSYQRYDNFRGWGIDVPSFMHYRGVPENNDGLSFYWDNRNYLQAYGYYNYGVTIDELYLEDIDSISGTVEYRVKKPTWYVLSGYTNDGLIYYKKVTFMKSDDADVVATAMLVNEPVYKDDFDPIIQHVFNKFPR